jgi:hypothetical protein
MYMLEINSDRMLWELLKKMQQMGRKPGISLRIESLSSVYRFHIHDNIWQVLIKY